MAPPHARKSKQILLDIDGNQFECQVEDVEIINNTPDGEKGFTLCPEGEYREETDPDFAIRILYLADWRTSGISDYFELNDGETVAFQYDKYPEIPAEHVRWTGTFVIKKPSVKDTARTTEKPEVTFQCIGEPEYTRP